MPSSRLYRSSLLLGLLALVVSGCSLVEDVVQPSGPLVTVTTRGGECIDGPCGSTVVVERDGTVRQTAPTAAILGAVEPEARTALEAAIAATDFAAILSHPFTGECPTAFDGQEFIFEFGAPGGTQRIATCEVEVDYGVPLFVATTMALGPFVPLPVT